MASLGHNDLPSGACHKPLLMIIQHRFRLWLDAVRQQAITWTNVDPILCRHIVLLACNELLYLLHESFNVLHLDKTISFIFQIDWYSIKTRCSSEVYVVMDTESRSSVRFVVESDSSKDSSKEPSPTGQKTPDDNTTADHNGLKAEQVTAALSHRRQIRRCQREHSSSSLSEVELETEMTEMSLLSVSDYSNEKCTSQRACERKRLDDFFNIFLLLNINPPGAEVGMP